jgi:WhiB family transcriptional regulator, redox-sensing transcriptional regulator
MTTRAARLTQQGALPGPFLESWQWQRIAACRGMDHLFFAPPLERGRARRIREGQAKAVCAGCPVLGICREHALSVPEHYGIWGGLTEEDRFTALASGAHVGRA